MAIFQIDDLEGARARLADSGVRVVWQLDLPDMSGTHLHPRDVPGAIVSLDRPDPPGSWRWAGPRWTGAVPADREAGGITGLTVASPDPDRVAQRWAAVLGVAARGTTITLDDGAQELTFVPGEDEGITDVRVARPGPTGTVVLCGTRLHLEEIPSGTAPAAPVPLATPSSPPGSA